jgi:hypothetical protein
MLQFSDKIKYLLCNTKLRDVMSCNLVDRFQRFGETFYLHLKDNIYK